MRSIWSGAISFGLVNIPVKLYSGSGENTLSLDMLAKDDFSPIKYKRVAASDGREVEYKDIVKGYEVEKGRYVIIEDEDFEKASAEKSKAIEIHSFINEEEIDSVYFEKPYYLEPENSASKAYSLLREALKKSNRVGVATFVMRNRKHLAVLKVMNEVIVLIQLRYKEEVRDYSELNLPKLNEAPSDEVKLAIKLIDQLSATFDPSEYKDTYVDELRKIIEAKSEGKTFEVSSETGQPTAVKDLMSALKASLGTSKNTETKTKQRPAAKRTKSTKKVSKKSKG